MCVVTIGTWNLDNLFRPGDDSGSQGPQEYESKLDALASTITDLAPDVLAVQEVGDPHTLDDLVERLNGKWRTALAEPDARGIRAGFLSKSALAKVEEISDFPDGLSPVQVDDKGGTIEQMGRPALKARIRKLGRTLKKRAVDILAFFARPGTSNGPTEAIKVRLEHLRGTALGFRNLDHYIARSLLETGRFRPRLHPRS